MIRSRFTILCVSLLFSAPMFSMVRDNRWFPLFPKVHSRTKEKPSCFSANVFFTTGDQAYDKNENRVAIPALFGTYDQNKLGQALALVGKNNPLPDEFRGTSILWDVFGKVQGQGVSLSYEQELFNPVSVGFSWFLMNVYSRQEFCLKKGEVGFPFKEAGDLLQLEEARRAMHKELGLCQAQSSRTGMGDFDFYVRVGKMWDYELKCRAIDVGLSLGALMPAGLSSDIDNAAAVPFGGNGHWGAYLRADAEFELREDQKFGFSLFGSKRFKKNTCMRLPVAGEHPFFGALVAPVQINPGYTFVFSPYVSIENLRKGLGARIGLHLTKHTQDSYCDLRTSKEQDALSVKKDNLLCFSEWCSDYATVDIFYDFGKVDVEKNYKPTIMFSWDIPFMTFVAKNNIITHRVSFGLQVKF
ncbi:hypothetical protein KAH94_02125 [bacterium]|nr:hypothetical protein [bacterium]